MKILNVLINENAGLIYRDMTDMQTIVLTRVASGKSSYETASPREQGIMDELAELGLLQDLSYEPTHRGSLVAGMASKHGPRDARIASQRRAAKGREPVQGDGRYTDVGDVSDNIEDGVASVSGRGLGMGGGRVNRDGAI